MKSALPAGSLAYGAVLAAVTAMSWVFVVRDATTRVMPMEPSGGGSFVLTWGVMMTAMMLPGAMPMLLLYRTVSRRLIAEGDRAIPAALFAALYIVIWTAFGIPVYGASVAVARLVARWPSLGEALPYGVATILVVAGVYQFTRAKQACLRQCESPLEFLMHRWRSGFAGTTGLATRHALYCIGCCWALMVVLVATGAMSIAWVVAIAVAVTAEKLLPPQWRTASVTGALLITLGIAVALRPTWALELRHILMRGM
jgi:predicted metal-binding membrane protein